MNTARIPAEGTVKVTWVDSGGGHRQVLGRSLNISEGGLGMELPESIPSGIAVRVTGRTPGLDARAKVRHSEGAVGKYFVGVQFLDGKRWNHALGIMVREDW